PTNSRDVCTNIYDVPTNSRESVENLSAAGDDGDVVGFSQLCTDEGHIRLCIDDGHIRLCIDDGYIRLCHSCEWGMLINWIDSSKMKVEKMFLFILRPDSFVYALFYVLARLVHVLN